MAAATTDIGHTRMTLRDGSTLAVERMSAASAPAVTQLMNDLSFDDRWRRFFQAVPEVKPSLVRQLCDVDQITHVAWLGTAPTGPVFEARFVVFPSDPTTAEIAFTVHPAWRGLGVAGTAVRGLGVVARAMGVTSFAADVIPENRPSVGVLRSLGLQVRFDAGSLTGHGPVPAWTANAAEASDFLRLHGFHSADLPTTIDRVAA